MTLLRLDNAFMCGKTIGYLRALVRKHGGATMWRDAFFVKFTSAWPSPRWIRDIQVVVHGMKASLHEELPRRRVKWTRGDGASALAKKTARLFPLHRARDTATAMSESMAWTARGPWIQALFQ